MRHPRNASFLVPVEISIHAPLTGCDQVCGQVDRGRRISIHAPLTGCDWFSLLFFLLIIISIHAPLTGCDQLQQAGAHSKRYFNPRTPHGVRRVGVAAVKVELEFQSTHPSRGATVSVPAFFVRFLFQSTHPSRGATFRERPVADEFRHFNPRTPHGVRPAAG